MASLILKNVPDELMHALRTLAAQERRSLNGQVIYTLERALAAPAEENVRPDAREQRRHLLGEIRRRSATESVLFGSNEEIEANIESGRP